LQDKENSDKEMMPSKIRPLKENGSITVTLTLSSAQVDEIRGVLRNLANILSITPPSYQVLAKTNGPMERKVFTYKTKDGSQAVDIQSILNGAAKFCKHCDVVVNNLIMKKASEMPGLEVDLSDPTQDEYYFCSTSCFMQFSISHGVAVSSQDKVRLEGRCNQTLVNYLYRSTITNIMGFLSRCKLLLSIRLIIRWKSKLKSKVR
jgi:histone-lysine N-methyltransferase MLL3